MTSLLDRPLTAIAAALRSGECTAEELAALAIERHEAFGERLGAYQVWAPERVIAAARSVDAERRAGRELGPLGGMPVSVKDLFGVRGYRTWAGTARELPPEWEREGFLVGTLSSQLSVFTGKTKMVELAYGGLGTNPHWGTPRNPWDATTARVPGGSSAGAGVSLQEGSAVVALGTDTACSIRTPAAWTGTVGLKPTYGRWRVDGLVPLSPTLDSVGGLARTVEDAAYFFAAVDPGHGDPVRFLAELGAGDLSGTRIGIPASGVWSESQDDVVEVVRGALREVESRGARLVELELPELDAAFELYATGAIPSSECLAFLDARLPGRIELLHETVRDRLRQAEDLPAREYLLALSRRRDLMESAAARLVDVDVLATPTVPVTPPACADVEELSDYQRSNRRTSRCTNPVNVLGLCALSLPCGLDGAGLPVGLHIVAPGGEDERLLRISRAVERALGTAVERIGRPPLAR
jgi:aspartyl-tRNA(Asn)/glutamyl-tRNA(Gln) amidotransferase subunit A